MLLFSCRLHSKLGLVATSIIVTTTTFNAFGNSQASFAVQDFYFVEDSSDRQ
ncbi:hypothetical protein AA0114_g3830 [Alternaria tenuissima]|uniref:Uncharacterized protein n=1 Tax=Alternaria tenuissima TaxID=119927 RepID=A0A4Q4MN25_9PLEO|nr:hypothetical protein AA0114_g3830 [Alternaria tenuissima]